MKKVSLALLSSLILVGLSFSMVSKINAQEEETVPVFRYWNTYKEGHFYTADVTEKESLDENDIFRCSTYSAKEGEFQNNCENKNDWLYGGAAFRVYEFEESDTLPVYRFYSSTLNAHFFTINKEEKEQIQQKFAEKVWKYEGIAYYTFKNATSTSDPVYRFWSPKFQRHFFTISEVEKNYVQSTFSKDTWSYEGIAFYAFPFDKTDSSKFLEDFIVATADSLDYIVENSVKLKETAYNYNSYYSVTKDDIDTYIELLIDFSENSRTNFSRISTNDIYANDFLKSIDNTFGAIEDSLDKEIRELGYLFVDYIGNDINYIEFEDKYTPILEKLEQRFYPLGESLEKTAEDFMINSGLTEAEANQIMNKYEYRFQKIVKDWE